MLLIGVLDKLAPLNETHWNLHSPDSGNSISVGEWPTPIGLVFHFPLAIARLVKMAVTRVTAAFIEIAGDF